MLKNREIEAREVLRKFVSSNDVESIEDEIADIKESLNEDTDPNCLQELRLMMKWKNLRRYVLIMILSVRLWLLVSKNHGKSD